MLAEALKVVPDGPYTHRGRRERQARVGRSLKCGRTHRVTASRAAMKQTRVVTMAGWIRRMSTPRGNPERESEDGER